MSKVVRDYFDKRATPFDAIYLNESAISRWVNTRFRRAIYDRFHIALRASGSIENKTVLDVGCGSGRYVVEYAKQGARRVVGVDLSPVMLDLARRLATQQGVRAKCEFFQEDFFEVLLDEKFDIVLAMGVFDYVERPDTFLERMVYFSNGLVIASFPGKSILRMRLRRLRYRVRNCPIFFYSESEVREIAHRAGLENCSLVFIPHSGTGYVLVGQVERFRIPSEDQALCLPESRVRDVREAESLLKEKEGKTAMGESQGRRTVLDDSGLS